MKYSWKPILSKFTIACITSQFYIRSTYKQLFDWVFSYQFSLGKEIILVEMKNHIMKGPLGAASDTGNYSALWPRKTGEINLITP